jgi:hypothetical protein
MTTWFCDAYASWQKGGVENANGRLRRWLPRRLRSPTAANHVSIWRTEARACLIAVAEILGTSGISQFVGSKGSIVMSKHSSPAYSLWPEQVRRRRSMSLTFAVSGFVFGLVCVSTAYNVISDFVSSATVQDPPAVTDDASVMRPPGAPTAASIQAFKPANRVDRTPTRAAKVTLPIIGTQAARSAETDGRGTDTVAEPVDAGSFGNRMSMITEDAAPQAAESGIDGAKPAAADELSIKPRKLRMERASHRYAAQTRQRRERPTSYAAADRGARSLIPSGVVSQTASWY